MNPEYVLEVEREVKSTRELDAHWKECADKKFKNTREHLLKQLEEIDQLEKEYNNEKNPSWYTSLNYSGKLDRFLK